MYATHLVLLTEHTQQSPRTAEEELKARIAQLEHENYMLKMERDLLKKVKELERRDRWGK